MAGRGRGGGKRGPDQLPAKRKSPRSSFLGTKRLAPPTSPPRHLSRIRGNLERKCGRNTSNRTHRPLPGCRHLPKHLTQSDPLKTPYPPPPPGAHARAGSGGGRWPSTAQRRQHWSVPLVTARPMPGCPRGSEGVSPPELGSHTVPPSGGRWRAQASLRGCGGASPRVAGRSDMHSEHPHPAYTPQPSGRSPRSQAFGTQPVKQRKQPMRPPMARRSLPQDWGWRSSRSPGRHVGSSGLEVPKGRGPGGARRADS